MKARLMYMKKEDRKLLGIHLWQVFEVIRIQVYYSGRLYRRETKQVYCNFNGSSSGEIMFYWYEVELID